MEEFKKEFINWINENRLLVIEVNYKRTGPKTILGRMLKFDQLENSILVYIDDTKTIDHIMINQIDDISSAVC